ncbi:MAG: ribosomal protein S18-alanine N-acetyltransferase [Clostridia bacterium]|nr:ribosomal protein S18-alanine N-acetyltransferase [Clostridia bacterium]
MPERIIRRMTMEDLDAVLAIEEACFARPWTRADYEGELTRNRAARYLVAVEDGRIAGFAGAWIILDESHITNIAVAEEFRRRGIGHEMTLALLQYLSNLGAVYTTLEVRESNAAAQGLYTGLGFIRVGRRKRYYEDNGEDAFIMVCDKLPPPDPDFTEPETVYEP